MSVGPWDAGFEKGGGGGEGEEGEDEEQDEDEDEKKRKKKTKKKKNSRADNRSERALIMYISFFFPFDRNVIKFLSEFRKCCRISSEFHFLKFTNLGYNSKHFRSY